MSNNSNNNNCDLDEGAIQDRRDVGVEPEAEEELSKCLFFDSMGLDDSILRGLYTQGFEAPSPIQQLAVRPIALGRDVIAQAQAGTGKTLAFALGTLQRVDASVRACQALILVPTRELADQIHDVVSRLGAHKGIKAHKCYGKTDINEDRRAVRSGVQVIVGTPGRVNGLILERNLRLDQVKIFVIDEAHEMLKAGDRGFQEQVVSVFRELPESAQSAIFSATLTEEVLDVTSKFMVNPVRILVQQRDVFTKNLSQFYIKLEEESWKLDTLVDLYETISIAQSIIFCNSRQTVDSLSWEMREKDFAVSSIHGDMAASERDAVMTAFRAGRTKVLISTDVLALGIDVPGVSLVVNFDVPVKKENYIHRVHRCGRSTRRGVAISFVTRRDVDMLRDIERTYDLDLSAMPVDIADLL